MKLLAISIESHDSSATYFDGEKLFFHKAERSLQLKRWPQFARITLANGKKIPLNTRDNRSYDILKLFWKHEVKKIWNIDFSDVDHVWFDVQETNKIDHHERHAQSINLLNYDDPYDAFVIMDGLGGDSWWSIFKKNKLYVKGHFNSSGGSIGVGMMILAHQLINDVEASKVMGYVSYGKTNEELLNYLRQEYDMQRVGSPITFQQKWPGGFSEFLKNMDSSDIDMTSFGSKEYFKNFFNNHMEMFKIPNHMTTKEKLDYGKTIYERSGEIVLEIFKKYLKPTDKIGYAGGVAQNVIWNTNLKNHFPNLTVVPYSTDEGLSLGVMECMRQKFNLSKMHFTKYPFVESDEHPNSIPTQETIDKAAEFLSQGKVVAWYQENGEIGPRALGNRSIFLDPRIEDGKNIINKIKNRESFRPFGASILEEYAKEYFDLSYPNPHMLYVGYTQKENLKCITHVDGTCRVQTVEKNFPSFIRQLLESFFAKTGCPVLLNTSLNIAGKPIAGKVEDAKTLYNTRPIDVLVVGDNIYEKK